MSKYTPQDTIEEDGAKLFSSSLDSNFFLLNEFSAPAGKDRYPDIDGQIRLRDGKGNYLNRFLHYQLKSTSGLKSEKYHCDGDLLDFLLSTNIPTLLIVSDVGSRKVYWFFIDEDQKEKLALTEAGNSGKTLDLRGNLITSGNPLEINQAWQRLAKDDDYKRLSDSVGRIALSFEQDARKCLGLLHLLQRVRKDELVALFNRVLHVEQSQIDAIMKNLVNEGVVSTTAHFYLLDNEQLGTESLHKLLSDWNLSDLDAAFQDTADRKRILRQLSRIEHDAARTYLAQVGDQFFESLGGDTNNDEVLAELELLDEYAIRVPAKAVEIIRAITSAKPVPPTVTEVRGLGPIEGRTHEDLIRKSIEVLDSIRYQEKAAFDLLVELSQSESPAGDQAKQVIEHLSKYNLHVLRQVGYRVQLFLVEAIEGWDDGRLAKARDASILICGELLTPSFEGTSMQDYQTMTFHSGSLNVTSELKDIRRRCLTILKRLYPLLPELVDRKTILATLQRATHTPRIGNYGTDLEDMVIEDTNAVIDYYLLIVGSADNELIKDIEEQTHWFSRRFGPGKLPRLRELGNAIATLTDYEMFRTFVGYDGRFAADMDWDRARRFRLEKVQAFVDDINEACFADWEKKILAVVRNYGQSEPGEFQYFSTFLFELGKQKPDLALCLIERSELDPFLVHLVAGLWSSSSRAKARELVTEWTKAGRNLSVSARLFDYVASIDEPLLKTVFRKAKALKDVQALNGVVCSITRNFDQDKELKDLFIAAIAELTKNGNYSWIDSIWHKGESVFKALSEADYDRILRNLLLVQNIEFHAEEILVGVAEKCPEKVIDFFYRRVVIKSRMERGNDDRYDAVPFEFHKIAAPLRKAEVVILPMLFGWYKKGTAKTRWLFRWEASHLFEAIFPEFSPGLEKTLVGMIETGESGSLQIALSVISKHRGEEFVWGVVKAIVEKYSSTSEYERIRGELFGYLSQTGVVSGEYGFVRALRGKQQRIQQSTTDGSAAVRGFFQEYEKYLDERIGFEQKRADEDIELQKRSIAD